FVTFGESDGILTATPLFEAGSREVYFGGDVGGGDRARPPAEGASAPPVAGAPPYSFSIGRFRGQRFAWVRPRATERQNLSWSDKRFVTRTRAGDWWLGRFLFRVNRFADLRTARPVAEYGAADGLASPVVYALFEDSRGDLWISTTVGALNGLARWEHGQRMARDMAQREGLTPVRGRLPSAVEEDRAGNVWIGFEQGGLARYADGRFRVFTTQDGLPDGSVSDLHADRNGRLWVGTSPGGLARVDDP